MAEVASRTPLPGDPMQLDDVGEGSPVLLVHGFTGSAEAWAPAIRSGLARRHRLLAVDLPGHGRTGGEADPKRYEVERLAAELVRVLDARGIDQADWVGYSMGGRIVLAAATLYPDRVARIVLESASPGIASERAREQRRRQDETLARRIETRGVEWFVDYWMGLPLFATQTRLSPSLLSAERARRLQNRAELLAAVLRGAGTGSQPSYWEALEAIEAPMLILVGALDSRYVEIGARMQERLPRAFLRQVPRVGHTVHLEDPARWLEEVVPFLHRRQGSDGAFDDEGEA